MSDTRTANQDPSMGDFLSKATYYSLFAMVLLMPFWVAFGRAFFGVGGWGVFYTLPIAVLMVFPYHVLIAILAFIGKKSQASLLTAILLLSYYFFAIMSQLSFVDGGDTKESIGSVLTFGGIPEALNTAVFVTSAIGMIVAMIATVASLIKDIIDRKHQHAAIATPAETTTNTVSK